MEKTTLGFIAALGAAAAAPAAYAAVTPADRVLNPTSIAELLEPVADPVATLDALQSQRQLEPVEIADVGNMQTAQLVVHHHHHHVIVIHRHHHHHHFWRRRFYHHHHHHHHHHHMF